MTEPVAPAAVTDPHRSLIRSVRGIFEGLTHTVNSFSGEGDIIAHATAALSAAAEELATLLDTRDKDTAAYEARMRADAKLVANVEDKHTPSPEAAALAKEAKRINKLSK